ncbi:unnamed protein product, partial [Coregonus sp. 'balchen']
MSNGLLLDRLACLDGSPAMSLYRRCLTALGTARGLDYLHSNNHVYRDDKSGNILLDEALVPKIFDFGLTRVSATQSCLTVMTERIVLLEILSGLLPVDENRDSMFLEMALEDFVDTRMTAWDLPLVKRTYSLANNCLNDRKNKRPLTKE